MINRTNKKVLIYCRVSDSKQKTDGHGLDSQEHRCRQYVMANDYDIEKVFPDDVSGGGDFMKRSGMVALLRYLDDHPHQNYIVLFDDLKRFARDREAHFRLKQELAARNASVECLNFRFDDTPEGEFMETIFAAQGQLERLQHRRQVIQKMRARVEQGFAVFQAPVGYKYQKTRGQGKMLFRDQPNASIMAEALEGYASGRFQIQAEVKRFLELHPSFPRNHRGEVSYQRVNDFLTQPIYAGYVEAPNWGVSLRLGKHEPLISFKTFHKIQERLKGNAKTPARKDLNKDFPLRGFITCSDCENPLTACWSKSKTGKRHPYYLCQNKGCESKGKSIRRDVLESEFAAFLGELQPTEELLHLSKAMFRDAWDQQLTQATTLLKSAKQAMVTIEKQIENLLDRVVDASTSSVITAYENRIDTLEKEKLIMAEKLLKSGKSQRTFEEMFELAFTFLANPQKLWRSDRVEHKRTVIKLAFSERIAYCRKTGLRTPKTTLPFKVLDDIYGGKKEMVIAEGFEPSTY